MMKSVIRDIQDMTDSREMLEAKPHPVISIFIIIFFGILFIALAWTYVGEKDVVVKAQGIVRPSENVSTIKSKVLEKVDQVNFSEGQKVNKGDVLFTLEKDDLLQQQQSLMKELQRTKDELNNLNIFRKSVTENTNYFEQNDQDQMDYYEKFSKYQTDYDKLQAELKQAELDLANAINQEMIRNKLQLTRRQLNNIQLLEQSMVQQKNLFTDRNNEYYYKYIDYRLNLDKLSNVMEEYKNKYETSLKLGEEMIPRQEVRNQKQLFENAKLDLENYQNEYILNIRNSIKGAEETLKDLNNQLEKANRTVQIYRNNQNYSNVMLEKYKLDTLVQINESIKAKETVKEDLEKKLEGIKINIQDRELIAPVNGTVNVVTDISRGDLLQPGMEVLTIVPDNNYKFKIELSISNQDIANIKVGDQIKYHLLALPYKEYGELRGIITKIGTDAKINPQIGTSYYTVEASIENKPLYSYNPSLATIFSNTRRSKALRDVTI